MKLDNPTCVRVGMTGTFDGKAYRVAGRAVVGIKEGGAIYGWHEFNLETDAGESATLVYEETDYGNYWRWFELFEPESPMSASEAAAKRFGESLTLDGESLRITRVDRSRVYHVEGKPPEAEAAGAQAAYFNAEGGGKIVVVSWTGSEVEYYRGRNLASSAVAEAFGLRGAELVRFKLVGGGRLSSPANRTTVFLVLFVVVVLVLVGMSRLPSGRPRAMVRYAAPDSPLTVGSTGHLGGSDYRIVSHKVVEVAEVGCCFERHEFGLQDEYGNPSLLIFGSKPGAKDWLLLAPLQPEKPVTPEQAGNVQLGQVIMLENASAPVTELFRERMIRLESPANRSGIEDSGAFYGFAARTNRDLFLVRWNAAAINFFRGRQVESAEMKAAFPGVTNQ
jgi:hypothetical protein